MIKKWSVLSSKYLHKHPPWCVLRADKVQLPNGHIIDPYYVFEYPDWVNVIARSIDGYYVMIRQYRHAASSINLELPAGVCDPEDANPMISGQRELLEETGFGGGNWYPWMVVSANPGTHTNSTYAFLAINVEKIQDPKPEDSEDLHLELLSEKELFDNLLRGNILQSLHSAALWKYFYELKSGTIPGL